MGAYQCRFGPNPPATHTLPVPYHPQIDPDFCVPAVILMWLDYVADNYADTYESNIWNFAVSRGWAAHGSGGGLGGVNNDRVDDLANQYLPFTVARWSYGATERRQAVADQERGLDFNDPTIVEVNGYSD